MSKQEARKITIIEELLAHRLSNAQAAQLLNLSLRQVQRQKAEAAAHGALAVLHKSRGKKPANSINPVLAQTLVKTYCTSLSAIISATLQTFWPKNTVSSSLSVP